MSYRITLKPSFSSDIYNVPPTVERRLERVLEELEDDPVRTGGHIKKLVGYRNLYRHRIDDFRMIYSASPDARVVRLLAVGPRRDVYARFIAPPDAVDETIPDVPVLSDEHVTYVQHLETPPEVSPSPFKPESLPALTSQDLDRWAIPQEYHQVLLSCLTDTDLFEADIPGKWKDRMIDLLFPRSISEVEQQPNLVLMSPSDLSHFVEGKLCAFLLELEPDQEAVASRSLKGPAIVKGGPGGGKSTVALYRVRALVDTATGSLPSILFTTHTTALASVSHQLADQLLGDRKAAVEVRTTDSVATGVLASLGERPAIASERERRQALDEARRSCICESDELEDFLLEGALAETPSEYLLEEFDWIIEGSRIESLVGYQRANRTGRGTRFDGPLRQRIWGIYGAYRTSLADRGRVTWGDVRALALEHVTSGKYRKHYDHVLIDEAQDLTPTALRLCVALCREPAGLFLTADAGQSLYNRAFSWPRVHEGLSFRGRARILKRNYRSTRQLGQAVSEILASGSAGDQETTELAYVRDGPLPEVKAFRTRRDQYVWVASRIAEAGRELRFSVAAAAVLCPTGELAAQAAEALSEQGLKAEVVEGRSLKLETPTVKVMTMHSAKGLEFPIVALPVIEADVMPLPPATSEEARTHEDAQRRIFHVEASRAMRRLFVSTATDRVSPLLEELRDETWDLDLGGVPA